MPAGTLHFESGYKSIYLCNTHIARRDVEQTQILYCLGTWKNILKTSCLGRVRYARTDQEQVYQRQHSPLSFIGAPKVHEASAERRHCPEHSTNLAVVVRDKDQRKLPSDHHLRCSADPVDGERHPIRVDKADF